MGAQYTDFLFKESNRGNHSWSPRPQATVTYSLNQNHNFRLNFTSWQSAPSLAETNVVPQQLDGFQWGRQKRGTRKLVDAGAETDRSNAGGR